MNWILIGLIITVFGLLVFEYEDKKSCKELQESTLESFETCYTKLNTCKQLNEINTVEHSTSYYLGELLKEIKKANKSEGIE